MYSTFSQSNKFHGQKSKYAVRILPIIAYKATYNVDWEQYHEYY
jgi:hypothetical protein